MKAAYLLLALALPLAMTTATAGWDTFPVCHDKDVRYAGVWIHVGVDCYPGIWVQVCKPDGSCTRHSLAEVLA